MSAFFFVRPDVAQHKDDMRAALKNPNARRVLRRFLGWCNVMGQSWARESACTDYNEGLRAAGLWLLHEIEHAAPGETAALLRESAQDWQAHQARHNKER